MHEITREYIHAKDQKKINWRFLALFQSLQPIYPSNMREEELIENRKRLEEILNHYPNLFSASLLQAYYFREVKYKKLLDLGKRFPEPIFMHRNGEVYLVKGNLDKAIKSFKKAAKQNYNPSLYSLAFYYFAKEDMVKHKMYIKKAALRGHFTAQILLDYYNKREEGYSGKRFSKYYKGRDLNSLEVDLYEELPPIIARYEELLEAQKRKEKLPKDPCHKTFKQQE